MHRLSNPVEEERLVSGRRGCALQCNFINRSFNPVQWSKIETSAKSISLQEKLVSIPMCALCRLLCTDCPIQWGRRGECPRGGGGRSHLGDSLLSEFHQGWCILFKVFTLSLTWKQGSTSNWPSQTVNHSANETGFVSLILFDGSMSSECWRWVTYNR